jgi:hypothetical protein
MKTRTRSRSSVLMILVLLAALPAAPVTRADGRETDTALPGMPASDAAERADQTAAADTCSTACCQTGQAPFESWLVTWDASTEGSGTSSAYDNRTVRRESHATARFVVNYCTDGTSEYYANEFAATYLVDVFITSSCSGGGGYSNHIRYEVIDPTRYDGQGPVTPNTVMPYKPYPLVGNQWSINSLNLRPGPLERYYLRDIIYCDGDREHEYTTYDDYLYSYYMTSYVRSPFNSEDGPLFLYDVDTVFDVTEYGVTYPLHLVEHVRVERLDGLNLTVRDIEVTQGLQLHNTIPLVQGRRTIVRAYVDIGTEPGPVADVTGRLRVYSGATLLGELQPFNMAGAISAKRASDWQQLDDTLNFELPWLWTQSPDLRFEVEVNHTRQVGEIRYDDNTRSVTLPLRDCDPLRIGYLPIRFAPPGVTPSSPGADIAVAHEWMRKVYPVADDELLYEPRPGITWKNAIDGANPFETFGNGCSLLHELGMLMPLSSGIDESRRLVGWLPGSASQQLDGMGDGIWGEVAWLTQKKAPRNVWRALLAHEAGHTYGLPDTSAMTGGYHWFDVYERSVKPEFSYEGLADFMYVSPMLAEPWDWVSPRTYTALYEELCYGSKRTTPIAEPQAAAEVLVISGRVGLTTTQSGQLEPVMRTTGTERIPPAGSSYRVVLKNGSTELAGYGFDAYVGVDGTEPYTPPFAPFVMAVPYAAGVNRVELTNKWGQVLASRVASAHPPTVAVQYPNAAGLTLESVETILWAGSDPDGDALSYAVLYSRDNGVTWNAIGAGITGTSYDVDFSTIPGSSWALIKVLASDGFYTAGDVSDQPFTVPGKPPVAVIVSPPAGALFKAGEQIKLQGYAVDLEEGMVAPESLSWSSDLDGALGAGDLREVTLSEGTHTITLEVSDGAASATTAVMVQVPSPAARYYTYLPLVLR